MLMPLAEKGAIAFFQSVSPRSCGFTVLPVHEMQPATRFVTGVLMFIGAAPGGGGGGIKITTLAVFVTTLFAICRGRRDTVMFGRTVSEAIVRESIVILMALIAFLSLVVGALLVTEAEAVDALPGTVIEQSAAEGAELLAGDVVDITVNQARQVLHYPISKLSVVVPLNGSDVQLVMVAPSGAAKEVYHGVLNAGTYRIALDSEETGQHTVNITMDGVLMESRTVNFE